MKRMIMIIALCLLAHGASATEPVWRIAYWYDQQGTNALTITGSNVHLKDGIVTMGRQGVVGRVEWGVAFHPTKAQIDALDPATVDAWWTAQVKTERADFSAWTNREKAMAKTTLDAINELRSNAGLSTYSAAQWKAKIKSEL